MINAKVLDVIEFIPYYMEGYEPEVATASLEE
jgi:hypothetical protein